VDGAYGAGGNDGYSNPLPPPTLTWATRSTEMVLAGHSPEPRSSSAVSGPSLKTSPVASITKYLSI